MKIKIKSLSHLFLSLILISFMSCATSEEISYSCGTYNGHQLYLGPKGGCYYINSNNNKTYVDRDYCHCN